MSTFRYFFSSLAWWNLISFFPTPEIHFELHTLHSSWNENRDFDGNWKLKAKEVNTSVQPNFQQHANRSVLDVPMFFYSSESFPSSRLENGCATERELLASAFIAQKWKKSVNLSLHTVCGFNQFTSGARSSWNGLLQFFHHLSSVRLWKFMKNKLLKVLVLWRKIIQCH